jgi:hypothetical protein
MEEKISREKVRHGNYLEELRKLNLTIPEMGPAIQKTERQMDLLKQELTARAIRDEQNWEEVAKNCLRMPTQVMTLEDEREYEWSWRSK